MRSVVGRFQCRYKARDTADGTVLKDADAHNCPSLRPRLSNGRMVSLLDRRMHLDTTGRSTYRYEHDKTQDYSSEGVTVLHGGLPGTRLALQNPCSLSGRSLLLRFTPSGANSFNWIQQTPDPSVSAVAGQNSFVFKKTLACCANSVRNNPVTSAMWIREVQSGPSHALTGVSESISGADSG
jgi:hypothetical protein